MLLKSEGRTSAEVIDISGCCEAVVNNWLKRYEAEGIRKRPLKEPCPELYRLKVEGLAELEALSQRGLIDLYYGDEAASALSRVSLTAGSSPTKTCSCPRPEVLASTVLPY